MRNQARRMATCAMMTALCVVLMWLGAILELGMYVAPLFAGLCLIPIGQKYGPKYQITVWGASSLLSLMLVPNIEQNLLYVGLFGWYPVLRPKLQRLPKVLGMIVKLLIFNAVVIAIEPNLSAALPPVSAGGSRLIKQTHRALTQVPWICRKSVWACAWLGCAATDVFNTVLLIKSF